MAFEISSDFIFFSDENKQSFEIKEIVYNTDNPKEIEERDKAISYLLIGIELYKKSKFKKALDFLNSALLIFKNYNELSYGIALFFLGEFYELKEEWEKSLENYKESRNILEKYNHKMSWDASKKIEKIKKEIEKSDSI
ncbi:MAG TPA: tetratricopeptide repeat protein [Spirochaetota bacterium]|nr:tetratricopeptide repeat protein [Spirochaetota bacterium]HOM37960.1 tetratricopeptide repeat protein [Spirochaetota bacterium]HPQ48765.1 tetratricopeptide repeat protein [Spirochaetota bacterium]